MSVAVGRAEYPVKTDATVSPLRQLPFNVRGFIVHNYTDQVIRVYDDNGRYWDTQAGLVNTINPPNDMYGFRAQSLVSTTTGTASVEMYNIRQPIGNNPQMQPAGIANVNIQSGSVTILGSPTIQIAAGQNVGITGTVTIAGNVNIANTPNVNITNTPSVTISGTPSVTISGTPAVTISGTPNVAISGTPGVTINNTGPINIINPDVIASFFTLDNQTAQITLTRVSEKQILQPILALFTRGGLLSVTATDSTTQTYEFLENEPMSFLGGFPLNPVIPWEWLRNLKSGAVVSVKFTGRLSFIYGY